MTLSNSADLLLEGLTVSSSEPGLVTINIMAPLDIPAIVPFKSAVDMCIERGDVFVVVDLENISFIDSPFVGTLMGCRKALQQRGGDLAICSASQLLQDRLSIMGLDRVFHFYANPQTAIADFHFWGSKEQFSFTIPLNRNCVLLLRKLICSVLTKKRYDSKLIFHVETIVDELANNAVDYSNIDSKSFFTSMTISRKKIVLVVKNFRDKIDKTTIDALFEKYKNPKINMDSSRGRGIPLIKMLSNVVNLDVNQTEIIVQVTKIVEV
jgi:anti-sigma B factor antagonist